MGVLRATGAHNRILTGLFVMEGGVGLVSWFIAAPLSVPLIWLFARQVRELMEMSLNFYYSGLALLGWLGIVAVFSALASLLPAWQATRITVREVLAYE